MRNPTFLFDVLELPSIKNWVCNPCFSPFKKAEISQDHLRIRLRCRLDHYEVFEICKLPDVTDTILNYLNVKIAEPKPKKTINLMDRFKEKIRD